MGATMARRIASAGSLLLLTAGALLIPTSAASAAERDGVCDEGEVCFYYNSNGEGSVSDFSSSVPNYGGSQPNCYEFKGDGNGRGECVKNNVASVWNRTGQSVTIYYNSNYSGPSREEALCHVFLYSIGIIEKHCEEDAFSYVMDTAKQAKERKENYQ